MNLLTIAWPIARTARQALARHSQVWVRQAISWKNGQCHGMRDGQHLIGQAGKLIKSVPRQILAN